LFLELSGSVQLYPSIGENHRDSNKWGVIQDLDDIARQVTRTPRPSTSLDKKGVNSARVVVKRTASSNSAHVYKTPGEQIPPLFSAYHFYLFQEYAPELAKVEVRVYIVSGNDVVHREATAVRKSEEQVDFWPVTQIRPLAGRAKSQ
jgi:hypothetical protein